MESAVGASRECSTETGCWAEGKQSPPACGLVALSYRTEAHAAGGGQIRRPVATPASPLPSPTPGSSLLHSHGLSPRWQESLFWQQHQA